MKTKILFAILILLCSCSSVKKTKTELKEDIKTNIEVKKTADENAGLTSTVNSEKKAEESIKKNTSAESAEVEETTIHTINYDSNSKVDSVTMRPAVSQEIIQRTVKGKNAKAIESTELLYSQTEVQSLFNVYFKISQQKSDSVNNIISSLKSEVAAKTKKAASWWKWLLVGMCVPVIGWAVWKLTPSGNLSFIWKNIKAIFAK